MHSVMPFQRFSIPTVRISDAFRFEPDLPGAHWEQVLETISRDFFRGSSYHLQLQTTEGDKYLRLYPREWHYFVSERRDRLWFMSMEIHSGRGEFMKLELDFHPLVSGPNANIEVCSSRADELIRRVIESIGVQEEAAPMEGWHETFSFPAEIIDVHFLEQAIRQLSREHLQRTPPIAFLSTTSGISYTGLSLFQLRKLLPRHLEELSVLSIGVTRPMSGQTLSLMFEFSPGYTAPFVSLNLLWGAESVHQVIRERICLLFGLQPRDQHAWNGTGTLCSVSLDWTNPESGKLWASLDQVLRAEGLEPQPLRSLYAHQTWDDRMSAVHDASLFLIDLSEHSPESLYLAGFARSSGKPVILLTRDQVKIPASFSDIPAIVYEHSLLGRELLMDALPEILTHLLSV